MKIALICGVFLVGFLYWPVDHRAAHIAPRTSPPFDKRPKCDALVEASSKGDLSSMLKLINSGVSPNAGSTGDEGISALSASAANGQLSSVELLLKRGADVNADDFWGGNALVGASLFGQVDVVKLLIARGADPNMDDDGSTALDYAARQLVTHETAAPLSNYRAIVQILQSSGAQDSLVSRPLVRLRFLFP